MNYKRQQMEAQLPPPSQLLCSHLWSRMEEAGVRLDKNDIVLISRIVCDYIKNTRDGKATALKLLGATVKPADPRHAYYPFGSNPKPLPPSELKQFAGWIFQDTYAIPYDDIEIEKGGGLESCESTGIKGPRDYCVKTVKDYGANGEVLVTLSNYARMMSERPAVRDTANPKVCEACPLRNCPYHPKQEPQQLMLTGESHGVARYS